MREILSCCRAFGIRRVMLNTCRDGRHVYEGIGFTPSPQAMRIMID